MLHPTRITYVAMALLLGGAFGGPANAVTVTVTDSGGSSYSCSLDGLNVGGTGAVAVNVSTCNPALGGTTGSSTPQTIPAGAVTVTSLTTTSRTPTITGTAEVATGEALTVTVNGQTYAVGTQLSLTGTTWSLVIPAALPVGTYNVVAKITNTADGGSKTDSTAGELVIQAEPVAAGADPGTGLWSPDLAAVPVVYVAGQSLNLGSSASSTRIPGCVNGASIDASSSCIYATSYAGSVNGQQVSVRLTSSQILSIRYYPNSSAPAAANSGYFMLMNSVGGGVGVSTTVTLSTQPGVMTPSVAACTSTSSRTPLVITGSGYCPIDKTAPVYYLNVRVNSACNTCNFIIQETSAEFNQ